MSNILNKIKIVGLAGALYAMVLNSLLAQTNNAENLALKMHDQIMNQLLAFETKKSIELLKGAITDLNNAQLGMDRRQQTSVWFEILAVIDKNINHNFGTKEYNATNSILRNLIPPRDGINGSQYASGVDPSVLKDPTARADYEAALKANSEKAENYTFQLYLQRINKQTNLDVERYLKSFYTSSEMDKKELNEIIDKSKLSASRKQQILDCVLP